MMQTLLLLLLSFFSLSHGSCYQVGSSLDLCNFSNDVNNGRSFNGTTVCLTADIVMESSTALFSPIGMTVNSNNFQGTFDGQGYVISNLVVISSSFKYVGLFGHSKGSHIKNVVIDKTCLFNSSYNQTDNGAIGAILGRCASSAGTCVVEGCVSMAPAIYFGKSNYFYLGGIVGAMHPNLYDVSIKNCVNYGSLVFVESGPRIGGIVGEMWNGEPKRTMKGCINFGKTDDIYIGGLVGLGSKSQLYEKCANYGTITIKENASYNVGGLVGCSTDGIFNDCFWAKEAYLCSDGSRNISVTTRDIRSFNSTTLKVEASSSLLTDVINDPSDPSSVQWCSLFFHSMGGSSVKPILVSSINLRLISSIIPIPKKDGNEFVGWFTSTDFTEALNISSCVGTLEAYARWSKDPIRVTFVLDNGEPPTTKVLEYGAPIEYPQVPRKEGFTFVMWNNTITKVPAHDVTIEALFKISFSVISIEDFGNDQGILPVKGEANKIGVNGYFKDELCEEPVTSEMLSDDDFTIFKQA